MITDNQMVRGRRGKSLENAKEALIMGKDVQNMAEKVKELRKMSRVELIEIIYALEQSEEKLQQEKEALENQLSERRLLLSEAGSIAEAAMGLSRIFQTAQETADQYLTSVAAMEKDSVKKAKALISDAQTQAETILAQAKQQAEEMIRSAEAHVQQVHAEAEACITHAQRERERLEAETDQAVAEKWKVFEGKVREILEAHSELGDLISHR